MKNLMPLVIGLLLVLIKSGVSIAAPIAPTLCFSATGIDISVNWTTVPDATGYTLYYAPYPYEGEDTIRNIDMGTKTSVSYHLWNNANYYIAVTSRDNFGESSYSNIDLFHLTPTSSSESQDSCQNLTWASTTPLNTKRDQFTGSAMDGKIYVFGGNGYPDGSNLNTLEIFDPASATWSYGSNRYNSNSGRGVEELTSAVVNNKLYVFGAWGGGSSGVMNFVEEYDPLTNMWARKANKPTTVSASNAVVYNNEIFLFGGYTGEYETNTVEAYNPATNTWRSVTTMPKTISKTAMTVIGTNAYVIGGIEENGTPSLNVIAYDFSTGLWQTSGLGTLPSTRAFPYGHNAPVINGKIYLTGGWSRSDGGMGVLTENTSVATNLVERYDPNDFGIETTTSLPVATANHVSVELGGALYVIGGTTSMGESYITNTVWKGTP